MAAPLAEPDRLFVLDAIRGFALFGVLLINLTWIASPELALPAPVRDALPSAGIDRPLRFLMAWLMEGKAQALFSMLFGLGFAIQLQRAQARGPGFAARYLRRLGILLAIGAFNLYFLWLGDILHLYALAGVVLLVVRHASDRVLLWAGLLLSVGAMLAFDLWIDLSPDGPAARLMPVWESGVASRYVAWSQGGYGDYLADNIRSNGQEYLGTVLLPFFMGQVIGRFLLGFWIARRGWFQDVARYRAGFRRALPLLLVGGLAVSLPAKLSVLTDDYFEGWAYHLANAGDLLGMLLVAGGYACAIALWTLTPQGRRRCEGLAAVGRMALTQYLLHALVYLGLLSNVGLGLLPRAGGTTVLTIAILFFALQVITSRWWLRRFRFGPMEWLWRWCTYGQRPAFRRDPTGT
ncbi:DUF418 domain-containing protein [Arenimonas sp. MALMAid1274]|uniref:DUF418 domain-containing protein n=1 Tax=Arenimonas sp. MALMAid1274 TaxID=3411630 RepID=UPI003BA07D53